MSYWRFFAMIGTSTLVMFGLMYLNTYLWPHALFSETRAYMAVLMGATMAVIMLSFMLAMYTNRKANIAIFTGSVILFAAMLYLVRSQVTVEDRSFMRAMIPHHSIAIMTSSRANISDPRVRKLADSIIAAQNKEIAEMKYLIAHPEEGSAPIPARSGGEVAPVATVDEALSEVRVETLDAEAMSVDEIGGVLDGEADCRFLRTLDSPAVLATDGSGAAVMKVNGRLVELQGDAEAGFAAEGVYLQVTRVEGATQAAADLVMTLDAGLTVGYRGFYECKGA
ncbi:DUF305 domain-containing protein [Roseovarius sp.]|uniref:DUF305 domain-containing protein n=1 Tax=Roseovarius sp. TaxID=1486281 RepID=UPI0026056D50|nr:DUF305 domain-containing protein [Roseovarius sp.]MDM8166042.1 DUF305 domain-containing protein [Roseovarius sp.]